jgi:hypothetical protein
MPHLPVDGRMQVIPWRRYLNIGPAGGELAMSLVDMTQWVRLLVGRGQKAGRRLFSEASFREMHSPQTPIPFESRPTYLRGAPGVTFMAYGLGWRLNDYRGRLVSAHTGNVYGFMATVGLLHDPAVGVVVLANADRTGLAPALVMRAFDLALDAPERDWSGEALARYDTEAEEERAAEAKLQSTRQPGTQPALPLARYAGTFEEEAYGRVTIADEGGRLVLRFPGAQAADLEHWHHEVFRMKLRGPAAYPRFATWEIDAQGTPSRLRVEGIGTFVRVDPEPPR